MRKIFAVCATLLLALVAVVFATPAHAATDVSGTWKAQVTTPNGDMDITFTFKQDGDKLTGTSEAMGNATEMTNGKVDGDKISFDIEFNGMTIHHAGTVNGDEIKMTASSDQFPGMDFTAKRAKP